MTWTAGVDRTTGTLVTAANWNAYLGVTGSLMETAPAKATTAGRIVYATGANAIAENANVAVTAGGQVKTKNPACRAFQNGAGINLTAASWTTLTFDSERYDNDAIHDTGASTGRLTCRTAGVYAIVATVQTDSGLGRYVGIRFRLNGATSIAYDSKVYNHTNNDANNLNALSTHYKLAVNDYVEVQVYVEDASLHAVVSGNASPEFGMAYLSDG